MSLNIQTSKGLVEISGSSGSVTKEKIITALGYTPSNFSGNYNDLKERPSITDDISDNLSVQDSCGNIIAKVNEDGITTTNVNTKTLILNGQDIEKKIEEIASSSSGSGGSQSNFSGNYNDLANRPSIKEDNISELTVEDNSGNIIMKVNDDGVRTTNVNTNTLILDRTSLKIETWTLTFADGTTTTKKVVVGA